MTNPDTQSTVEDVDQRGHFRGNDEQLCNCIAALLDLNDDNAVSHRVPNMAVTLLEAARQRLADQPRDDVREALEARAAEAEHRLYSFRRHNAARWQQLSEFVKERAPDLWSDYAAVSVNGSTTYGNDEPTYEREINILKFRAEAAEERAVKAEAKLTALSTDSGPTEEQAASDGLTQELNDILGRIDRSKVEDGTFALSMQAAARWLKLKGPEILTRLRTPDEGDRALEEAIGNACLRLRQIGTVKDQRLAEAMEQALKGSTQ